MITFRYLLSVAVKERLDMCLMDVITIYLYGKLDKYLYKSPIRTKDTKDEYILDTQHIV